MEVFFFLYQLIGTAERIPFLPFFFFKTYFLGPRASAAIPLPPPLRCDTITNGCMDCFDTVRIEMFS